MNMKRIFFCCILSIFIAAGAMAQVKKVPATTAPATTVKKAAPAAKTAPKPATAQEVNPGKTKVKITTDLGVVVVRLYDATPKHRDNFIKLVKQGFYDSLLFHRVIQGFMIQGGDPMSKNAQPGVMLGMGGGDMERIPAEFNSKLCHIKGALAAARDGNPEKASSACQFYIVQGNIVSDPELDALQQQKGIKYTPAQRAAYKTKGGTPFLDMDYTVYGEVVSGLDVIDKIAAAPGDASNRPNKDVHMKMELLP